jgi:hypothetical protein
MTCYVVRMNLVWYGPATNAAAGSILELFRIVGNKDVVCSSTFALQSIPTASQSCVNHHNTQKKHEIIVVAGAAEMSVKHTSENR